MDTVTGPTEDFVDFLEAHQTGLLRFAMVLTGDAALAADVVADVLDRVFERWAAIAVTDKQLAYVRRMVVNDYLSWRRSRRRLVPLAGIPETIDVTTDHAETHAERTEMLQRLAALPSQQRATLVLRYYQGLSDAEIAGTLGCWQSTVRSNASRALAALRIAMHPLVPSLTKEI